MLAEVDRYAPPEPTAEAVDRETAARPQRFPVGRGVRRGARRDPASTRSTCARRSARICGSAPTSISASRPPQERAPGADRRLDQRPAPPRRRRRSVPAVRTLSRASLPCSATEKLKICSRVESGVADHRRDARSAPQVDDTPERAEQAGRHRRVDALQQVAGAERDARARRAPTGRRPASARSGAAETRAGFLRGCRRRRARPARTARRRAAIAAAPAAGCVRRCAATGGSAARRGARQAQSPARRASAARRATTSPSSGRRPSSTSRGRSPCAWSRIRISPMRRTASTSDRPTT